MAQLEYFVVCRGISSDIDSDEITLSGILETIDVEDFPDVIPKLMAVSVWRIDEDEANTDFQAMLTVTPPGWNSADFPMNLVKGQKRHRAIQSLINIPLDKPGEVLLKVTLNGKYDASHIIEIRGEAEAEEDEELEGGEGIEGKPR